MEFLQYLQIIQISIGTVLILIIIVLLICIKYKSIQLDSLKNLEWQKSKLLQRLINSKRDCFLCHQLNPNVITYCKHAFHAQCLSQWFKNNNKICPQCRQIKSQYVNAFCCRCFQQYAEIKLNIISNCTKSKKQQSSLFDWNKNPLDRVDRFKLRNKEWYITCQKCQIQMKNNSKKEASNSKNKQLQKSPTYRKRKIHHKNIKQIVASTKNQDISTNDKSKDYDYQQGNYAKQNELEVQEKYFQKENNYNNKFDSNQRDPYQQYSSNHMLAQQLQDNKEQEQRRDRTVQAYAQKSNRQVQPQDVSTTNCKLIEGTSMIQQSQVENS